MRPLLNLLDRLALRFAVGLILIESIGAASSLRADQTEDSLDQILLAGDSMDLLKYADRYKTPADQPIIFKRLKGKIDTGQAADRFILAMIALAGRNGSLKDALLYLSYFRVLIFIDASTCSDPSAGGLLEGIIFGSIPLQKEIQNNLSHEE